MKILESIWNVLGKIVTSILCPNPKNRLPYSETQGEKITLNGVEYIRCYYEYVPWPNQGEPHYFRWGWLTKEDCMDARRRMGREMSKTPCSEVENCWGKESNK